MDLIPQYLDIQNFRISTSVIFFGLSFFISLFVYWHETRRDGFEEERAFDLVLMSTISALIFSRIAHGLLAGFKLSVLFWHVVYFWRGGFNVWGALIGFAIPVIYFTRKWNWSVYRITDTLSAVSTMGLSILFLGLSIVNNNPNYVVLSFVYFILYILLTKIRTKYRSGLAASVFYAVNAMIWPAYNRSYLPFAVVLFTMSLVNLYFREKRNPMKSNLPASFIEQIANILHKKEKQLDAEQSQLLSEDPNLMEGRDTVDEYLDDVQEDEIRTVHALRLQSVKNVKRQVRRALAKIKIGSYGICEVCGKEIGKERLMAYPEATTCVEHAE